MEMTEKSINLKDFLLELENNEDELSISVFRYNGNDEHVTIPGYINGLQVNEIDFGAFKNNDKIKKITIEKGVIVIGYCAFENYTELTEVELPDGLLEIGYEAFDGCGKLAKIQFPESILSIGNLAFKDCEKLTSVFIPKDVEDLGDGSFTCCSGLKEIIVDDDNLEYSTMDGILFNKAKNILIKYPEGKNGNNYAVPDTVNYFENMAFVNCGELVTITLPVKFNGFEISAHTFAGSLKLEQVIAQDKNPGFTTIDGVLFDKERKALICYPCGKKESEYTIPAGIERIAMRAFNNCKYLKAVIFPESLRMIERYAFADCENLTSITLPVKLKGICSFAFFRCKQLKKVSLSRNTRIGHEAFDECLSAEAEIVYIA